MRFEYIFRAFFTKNKKQQKLLWKCEICSKMFRKVSERFEAVSKDIRKIPGGLKMVKSAKIAQRPTLRRNNQVCPKKKTVNMSLTQNDAHSLREHIIFIKIRFRLAHTSLQSVEVPP